MKINVTRKDHSSLSKALSAQHLDNFHAWWQLSIAWLEPPNLERGGWSGVGCWQFFIDQDQSVNLYVKRQQNHTRFSFRYFFRGLPTFMVEHQTLCYLRSHKINVPEVIYFGVRDVKEGRQAILVTRELEDCVAFSQCCKASDMAHNPALMNAIAKSVQKLHLSGIQHRALYPKHLYVHLRHGEYQIAFLDLEKAKHMWLSALQRLQDLRQLMSRFPDWPEAMQHQFFEAYSDCFSAVFKWFGWWWLSRSLKRLNEK